MNIGRKRWFIHLILDLIGLTGIYFLGWSFVFIFIMFYITSGLKGVDIK